MAGASKRELISMKGLDEFKTGLRKIDSSLPALVKRIADDSAKQVVTKVKPLIPLGPAAHGHLRGSVKVASTQTGVRVAYGGSSFPYAPWLDFGGNVGRKKSVKRPFIKSGRYVWPVYKSLQSKVQNDLRNGLQELADQNGIEINMGGSG